MLFSRKAAHAVLAFGLCALISPSAALSEEVASKGAGHNGVFLHATKTPAANGVIITLMLDCRKNWGGTSAGAAFVQMVGVQSSQYQQQELRCEVSGGADGATQSNRTTNGVFFANTQQVVVIASIEHQERSNWQVWQSSIENTVKGAIDNIIKSSTNPAQILSAASAAGFSGKLL